MILPTTQISLRYATARRRPARRLFAILLATIAILGGPAALTSRADWRDMLNLKSEAETEEKAEERAVSTGTRLDTRFVGDYVTAFGGLTRIEVRGVGLVNGLEETGADPPPSHYRTALVDEMKRQGVDNPNQILAMPSTAMVMVKAHIPINVRKGDTFDVKVSLPPGSESTSLAGGVLFATRLSEQQVVGGRRLKGHVMGIARGPILTSSLGGGPVDLGATRRGKVLGGGTSTIDRDLAIAMRNEFRSGRNSRRVAEAIGQRFHGHNRDGTKEPMAEAKTDQQILLRVPEEYRHNFPRYINVIRSIAVDETPISRRVRLKKLEQRINVPEKCELAALRLEALGAEGVPALKRALLNQNIEVRFNAAMALTYMGKTDGLEALAEAAREVPAFRIYAFAAMACCQESDAAMALSKLLDEPVEETRYGAFRALTELNERDPIVRSTPIEGDYKFHVLNTEGPPLVHVTNHTKAEIVLFGSEQKLLLPATLRAGPQIQIVADSGSETVTVSRYSGRVNGSKEVSPRLRDIIVACDALGATYPDVASFLAQAARQHNLPGNLAVDALPTAGRMYVPEGETQEKHRIGSEYTAPNLYAPPAEKAADAQQEELAATPGEAAREESADQPGSMIRTVGAEEPASDPAPSGTSEAPEPEEGKSSLTRTAPPAKLPQSQDHRWYDPRGWFDSDEDAAGGGPPIQSEPE